MTDGRPFSEVEPDGRNPDATRTNADEARLAFVRPREGDSKSPPGRKDSPNASDLPSRRCAEALEGTFASDRERRYVR